MALVVNTNVPSIASQRYLMESRKEMETAMERLSSGKRINSAADDAAGLAIANRMTTQIQGLNVAIRNANDGMSVVQTAEGAMSEVTDMLQRMRDLALQAVHGVNNDADRATLDAEVQALKAEIDRVSETTTFNNQSLLNGTYDVLLQIGKDASETMALNIASVATAALGLATNSTSSSSDPIQTLVSQRLSTLTSNTFDAGDIVIDGAELRAFGSGDDISDLVGNINSDIETVTASAFNTVVAKVAGTGVVSADTVAIRVGQIGTSVTDDDYQAEKEVFIAASSNMTELVANINAAFFNGEVVASQTDDGKLVLSNSTGATISVAEATATGQGTTGAYDGGTGFQVTAASTVDGSTAVYASGQQFAGFLKLTSVDDTPITIDHGNSALSSPGDVDDLSYIGFQRILEDPEGNYNQVIGETFASTDFTSTYALGQSSVTGKADLTINDVEIYDDTLAAASDSFQGRLDLINAFSDETGVVASAYFERTFSTTNTTFVADLTFEINGISVAYGASATAMVTNINALTDSHGLTAALEGSNIVLTGDNVQVVDIQANDYTLGTNTTQAPARRTADTAPTAQTVSLGSNDVTANRVFQLTIDAETVSGVNGASTATLAVGSDYSFLYTASSTDDAGDVMEGLKNKLFSAIAAAGNATTGVYSTYASVAAYTSTDTAASITLNSAMGVGDRAITLSVANLTASNEALGGASTNWGAIKLSSIDGNPISIELGEGTSAAAATNAHGFKELNVGDSTYDANDPTFEMTDTPTTATVSGLSISTSAQAEAAITVLDDALESVIQMRADLGAVENRLDHTVSNLSNVVENTSAARSRIEDADFALEAASLARAQILQQAGTAMLAQANAAPQNVLSLLG